MADENTTPNGPLPTATPIEPENETLEEKGIWSECWDKITTLYEKYKRERKLNPISDTIIADLNDAFSPKMDEAHEGVEPVDLDETPRIKPAEKFTFGALVMGILGAIGTAIKNSLIATESKDENVVHATDIKKESISEELKQKLPRIGTSEQNPGKTVRPNSVGNNVAREDHK